jgi:uncharacterized protein (DUF2141 family)
MKKIIAVLTVVSLVFLMGCDELAKDLTSTISGTVYNDGEIVPNVLVFLLSPGDTITAGLSLSNATVGKADGTYILVDVITGNHIVCAVKDVNGNLTVDAGVDLVGYHGEVDTILGISIPQTVTLEKDGDDLENIDIDEMFILPGGGV